MENFFLEEWFVVLLFVFVFVVVIVFFFHFVVVWGSLFVFGLFCVLLVCLSLCILFFLLFSFWVFFCRGREWVI